MSLIIQIDQNHIAHYLGTTSAALIFKPEKYQTYGAARSALKNLLDIASYSNLSQQEKEVIGRWSLVIDKNELNKLFTVEEQIMISLMHQSQIQILNNTNSKKIVSSSWKQASSIIYKGSKYNEILEINVSGNTDDLSTEFAIRIFDVNNIKVIAQKGSLKNTNLSIINLGTINYQPANDTILEIQMKRTSGSGKIIFENAEIEII